MDRTFRPRKSLLVEGVLCAAVFVVAILGYGSLLIIEDRAPALGWLGIVLFGTMLILSIAMIVTYFRTSVTVKGDTFRIQTLFRDIDIWSPEITGLEWKWTQKVRLSTIAQKVTIELKQFDIADRLEIIRACRRLAPPASQTSWNEFCHLVALPLREGREPRRPSTVENHPLSLPERSRVFVSRRRYDYFFGTLFFTGLVGAAIVWFRIADPRAFAIPFVVVMLWLFLRFSTPKEGQWIARWTATKESKLSGLVHLALPVMFVPVLICAWLGINGMIFMWLGILVMLGLFAFYMPHIIRREKEQRALNTAEASLSAKRWEAEESLA